MSLCKRARLIWERHRLAVMLAAVLLLCCCLFFSLWQIEAHRWSTDRIAGEPSMRWEILIRGVHDVPWSLIRVGLGSSAAQVDIIPSVWRLRLMLASKDPVTQERGISIAYRDRNRLYIGEVEELLTAPDDTVFVLALLYLDSQEVTLNHASLLRLAEIASGRDEGSNAISLARSAVMRESVASATELQFDEFPADLVDALCEAMQSWVTLYDRV